MSDVFVVDATIYLFTCVLFAMFAMKMHTDVQCATIRFVVTYFSLNFYFFVYFWFYNPVMYYLTEYIMNKILWLNIFPVKYLHEQVRRKYLLKKNEKYQSGRWLRYRPVKVANYIDKIRNENDCFQFVKSNQKIGGRTINHTSEREGEKNKIWWDMGVVLIYAPERHIKCKSILTLIC